MRPRCRDAVETPPGRAADMSMWQRRRCPPRAPQANLHEYRHYQFGKTLVFLRNGVEVGVGATGLDPVGLVLAVQPYMGGVKVIAA